MLTKTEKKTFILNLAPNGIIPTKVLTPYVPITPEEVTDDLQKCMKAGGITYLHLHARDEKGQATGNKEIYRKFIAAIKEKYPELVLCVSCSGRMNPAFEARAAVLELTGEHKPDMASLTLGSLNFSQSASINSPETIIRLAEKMQEKNIKPELEIFDVGMMNFAQYMIRKGYLQPPFYFNIIIGNIFSAQSKLSHLSTILQELPEHSTWSVGGIGNAQLPAAFMSLSQQGGIRTGLEDNIWLDSDRKTLATNADLVERIHQLANIAGLSMMTPEDFRKFIQ